MTATTLTGARSFRVEHARWLLIGMHVPIFAFPAMQVATGAPRFTSVGLAALPLVMLAAALQLRHSLAAARGQHPRHWPWSLALLLLIAWVPLAFVPTWATMQWFAIASCAMLLPLRVALLVSLMVAFANAIWLTQSAGPSSSTVETVWRIVYGVTIMLMGGFALYGAARLVRVLDDLRDARAALGDLAIGRERLRISRDLHDSLGQSLSAISLKGELAMGLLNRHESDKATAEIESLVTVARSALHDMRDLPHRELPVSLSAELERATDLLTAANIEPRLDVGVGRLSRAIEDLFAWGLREGITNVLRHSAATTCSITIHNDAGKVRLVIENDGALATADTGHGLSGLAARASTLAGAVRASALSRGRFRLQVDVPEAAL